MTPAKHLLRQPGVAMWPCWLPMVCLLLLLYPNSAYGQEGEVAYGQLAPEAQAVAQAINQRRAENGLPALTLHSLLNQAAQGHVDDMVAHGVFGHVGSDGSFVRQRVQRVGYAAGGYASENWVSATSPETAMSWWMNDWIHRVNILNPRWQELGVGVGSTASGRMIFVTVFTAGNGVAGDEYVPDVAVASAPGGGTNYTIQPGDTLIGIAARYGLDWTQIAQANEMHEEALLQIGQTLWLPGVQSLGDTAPVSPAPSGFIPAATNTDGNYVIQPGDTLLGVAIRYDLTWQELASANGLGEHDLLQIGQAITIPGAPAASLATTSAADQTQVQPVYYTVQAGDTIFSIALQHGLDWQALLTLNGFSESSVLQIDQQIRLR